MANNTSDLEGTLWKWTNYFTGWQARWFVLENGILSYFKSQDDVINGCKGSIKMSVCDVNVHPTDTTRLDLIIPGEAHFYVRAATPHERQQWLVALGSSKAGLHTQNGIPAQISEEISGDGLRAKKSELRLYCDLLMQQVHSVKQAVHKEDGEGEKPPDLKALEEASSLLGATCDTFIQTLDDCMQLVNASHVSSAPATPTSPDGRLSGIPENSPAKKTPNMKTNNPWQPVQRSSSVERYIPPMRSTRSKPSRTGSRSRTASESSDISAASSTERPSTLPDSNVSSRVQEAASSSDSSPVASKFTSDQNGLTLAPSSFDEEEEITIKTFFTAMPTSFMDVQLKEDGGIPVLPFLDACKSILVIFDKLNPTAFIPVKLDLSGNIRKIQQKYSIEPGYFETLQSIVLYEVEHRQNHMSQSATIALLWLKRGVEYIREFICEFMLGTPDLSLCAGNAYAKTLRKYHGTVVRGVFALAQKSVPTREEFITQLASEEEDVKHPDLEKVLIRQAEGYVTAQDELIRILNDFYNIQGLDLDEQV